MLTEDPTEVARMTAEQEADALERAKADGWVESQYGYERMGADGRSECREPFRLACSYAMPVVDMPATHVLGSDWYAVKVASHSPSGKTVSIEDGRDWDGNVKFRTFRKNRDGRYVSDGHHYLTLGHAQHRMHPSH